MTEAPFKRMTIGELRKRLRAPGRMHLGLVLWAGQRFICWVPKAELLRAMREMDPDGTVLATEKLVQGRKLGTGLRAPDVTQLVLYARM